MRTYLSILLIIYLLTVVHDVICFDEGRFSIIHRYDDGFIGKLSLIPGTEIKNGWNMVVTFSEPIKKARSVASKHGEAKQGKNSVRS